MSPTAFDDLSARQRQVAGLAAEGHPNRHIADRLHLTVDTVKHHLTATYRVLGVANRTQLANLLRRPPTPPAHDTPPPPAPWALVAHLARLHPAHWAVAPPGPTRRLCVHGGPDPAGTLGWDVPVEVCGLFPALSVADEDHSPGAAETVRRLAHLPAHAGARADTRHAARAG